MQSLTPRLVRDYNGGGAAARLLWFGVPSSGEFLNVATYVWEKITLCVRGRFNK